MRLADARRARRRWRSNAPPRRRRARSPTPAARSRPAARARCGGAPPARPATPNARNMPAATSEIAIGRRCGGPSAGPHHAHQARHAPGSSGRSRRGRDTARSGRSRRSPRRSAADCARAAPPSRGRAGPARRAGSSRSGRRPVDQRRAAPRGRPRALRSSTTQRLLRFQIMNGALSPLTKGGMPRAESPVPGCSTLITSAPWSASIIAQYGPDRWLVRSRTVRPSSDPGIMVSVCGDAPMQYEPLPWGGKGARLPGKSG